MFRRRCCLASQRGKELIADDRSMELRQEMRNHLSKKQETDSIA